MDPVAKSLFDGAAGQSFVVLLLLGAVVIIGRMLQSTLKDRITDLKERIGILEKTVDECHRDRAALWDRIGGKAS